MPDQIAPEYKEADRRSGPNQENTERARAGVTGHHVRYVLIFGLLAVIIVSHCVPHLFSLNAVRTSKELSIIFSVRAALPHRFTAFE